MTIPNEMPMRIALLMTITIIGLVAASSVAAGQPAVWTPRKLVNFSPPVIGNARSLNSASCDQLIERLRPVLLHLGARASDLKFDQRNCQIRGGENTIDVAFSVLAPAGDARNAAGTQADATWQIVELRTNQDKIQSRLGFSLPLTCAYLDYVTMKVLPLFSIRYATQISRDVCSRTDIGLRAQVLKPTPQLAAALRPATH
jgi:hypothetical protein